MPPPQYRPEIDGLRCIAILSVLVFHLDPRMAPGGFLGVDVFFVISGYLITLSLQSHGYEGFYRRRIVRLFPALIATILATIAVGWLILLPEEFKSLGKHARASAAFVQNINLNLESGYFDKSSELKPLLHLWSLAIEEQFYIFWPLILIPAWKKGFATPATIALMLLSLIYASWLCANSDAHLAFYRFGSRAWEILVGCSLALLTSNTTNTTKQAHKNIFATLGIAVIVLSFYLIDDRTAQIPGALTIPTILGAAAVIYGSHGGLVGKILSHPIPRYIGRLSYPLYLVHWPIIAYKNIVYANSRDAEVLIACLLLAFTLAALCFHCIEKPIQRYCRQHSIGAHILGGTMIMLIAFTTLVHTRHIPARQVPEETKKEMLSMELGGTKAFTIPTCIGIKKNDFLPYCATDKRFPTRQVVWGDSKADAIYWSLVKSSNKQTEGWGMIGLYGCSPMLGTSRTAASNVSADRCNKSNKMALSALIHAKDISTVLIATAGRILLNDDYVTQNRTTPPNEAATVGLSNAVRALQESGKKVMLLEDNPTIIDPISCISRASMLHPLISSASVNHYINIACSISYNDHLNRLERYKTMLTRVSTDTGALIIQTDDINCDLKNNQCAVRNGKDLRYSYGDHYSDLGGAPVATRITERLLTIRGLH